MRPLPSVIGMVGLAAGAAALPADPAGAVCSVFGRYPCAPTACSAFQRRPCMPEIEYPIGQDLHPLCRQPDAAVIALTLQ